MNRLGSGLAAVGTALVGVGLGVTLGLLPQANRIARRGVDLLGTDYLLLATVGVLALVATLLVTSAWATSKSNQIEPPDPERIPPVPRPGESVDRFIDGPPGIRQAAHDDQVERVRGRLRHTATETVMRRHACTREAARLRVDSGSWTDDVEAAAFLGGPAAPRPPWTARLSAVLSGKPWVRRGAHRAAAAIVALAEGTRE